MANDKLVLSLDRVTVDVNLVTEQGEEKAWKLKELTGKERNRYLNKMTSRVRSGKDGKAISITNFEGFQADLLKICLYDENDELVTEDMIEGLPSSTQQVLFDKAKEISGLDNDEEGEEKND